MSTADAKIPNIQRIDGPPPRVLVVRAAYYQAVVEGMTEGAIRILRDAGATYEVLDVAGAFELPQAIRIALRGEQRFDGFVALGCVVKGETDHYHYICSETMAGLMHVALHYGIPLGSGLLTVHTIEQAVARSRPDRHNKGSEAAAAALLQIDLARRLGAV